MLQWLLPAGHSTGGWSWASREISQRYNHPLRQAHLAAAGQVAALVRKAGERIMTRPADYEKPGPALRVHYLH
jgi:hypothetical protein